MSLKYRQLHVALQIGSARYVFGGRARAHITSLLAAKLSNIMREQHLPYEERFMLGNLKEQGNEMRK